MTFISSFFPPYSIVMMRIMIFSNTFNTGSATTLPCRRRLELIKLRCSSPSLFMATLCDGASWQQCLVVEKKNERQKIVATGRDKALNTHMQTFFPVFFLQNQISAVFHEEGNKCPSLLARDQLHWWPNTDFLHSLFLCAE